MQTPLAWLRRKPGQTPLTSWKVSITRACVRRPGESQPATKAKHPTTPKTAAPITASLTIAPLLAKDENRYGVDKSGSFGTVRSLVPANEPDRPRRCSQAMANARGGITIRTAGSRSGPRGAIDRGADTRNGGSGAQPANRVSLTVSLTRQVVRCS